MVTPHWCRNNNLQYVSLQWLYNGRDGVSNHRLRDYLHNSLLSKKRWKLRVTGLWVENSPVTGEIPTQRGSNAEMLPFDEVIMYATTYGVIRLH